MAIGYHQGLGNRTFSFSYLFPYLCSSHVTVKRRAAIKTLAAPLLLSLDFYSYANSRVKLSQCHHLLVLRCTTCPM
jgi:hypothetical protein